MYIWNPQLLRLTLILSKENIWFQIILNKWMIVICLKPSTIHIQNSLIKRLGIVKNCKKIVTIAKCQISIELLERRERNSNWKTTFLRSVVLFGFSFLLKLFIPQTKKFRFAVDVADPLYWLMRRPHGDSFIKQNVFAFTSWKTFTYSL